MCDMTNECKCTEVETAYSQKDVEFSSSSSENEFIYDGRLSVDVCVGCGEPDWRTMC